MSKLKIAIQKSGRLYEDSIKLLRDCSIFYNDGKHQLKVFVDNFPLEIFYLRNSDIPQYLEDGVVDVAIVGENLLIQTSKKIDVVEHLGFSKCRVSMAVPKDIDTDDLSYFNSKKIATSYTNTLLRFLDENNIKADIHVISGSQAIAAMTFGTETIPQVYKIFGPGNQCATAAKEMATEFGVAIDMPAGPSEVLVIADKQTIPEFLCGRFVIASRTRRR